MLQTFHLYVSMLSVVFIISVESYIYLIKYVLSPANSIFRLLFQINKRSKGFPIAHAKLHWKNMYL